MQNKNLKYNNNRFYGPKKYFCYAPFGSMFISYNGKVSPCYACKAEENLNNKTLQEIWTGAVFTGLRKHFQNGEIPDACSFCKNHLLQGNYGSILANKYDHYLLSPTGKPVIAELELSNKCHLECIMCSGSLSSSIREKREKLPPVTRMLPDDFMRQFTPFLEELKSLELTGGDPLLIDDYYQILSIAEKINPELDILITTNANTFTQKVRELLNKKLRLSFNVSLDSLNEETYAQIRRNGSLQKAIENIDRFAEYVNEHNTSLGFLVCPLKYNWKELPHFVDFANKYKATLSYHVVFKPAEHALWSFSSEILKEIALYLKSFKFSSYDFNSRINVRSYKALVTLIETWQLKASAREQKQQQLHNEMMKSIDLAKKKVKENLNDDLMFDTLEKAIKNMKVLEYAGLVYIELAKKTKQEITNGIKTFSPLELERKMQQYHSDVHAGFLYQVNLSDNDKYMNNLAE
ncbi:MAG TPA: radical SAM protein [Bacteroidales bacterium]|nr:radical SAM protein [Bacteroidales bacterium]